MKLSAVHLHRNSSLVEVSLHPISVIPLITGRGIEGGGFFANFKIAAYCCQAVIAIVPKFVRDVDVNASLKMEVKMKLKIVKIITVFLITLGVMTPALVTFGLISEQHNFQGLYQVVYKFQRGHEGDHNYILNYETTELRKDFGRLACAAANVASQLPTPTQQRATANLLLKLIFILFPSSLALGIILYDRYCIYRNAIFKQKVQMLEKLWQQSIQH